MELRNFLQSLEKPVSAPLQKINLSNCRLSSVPDFGILPELYHLNLSFNPLDQVAPQQFSSYCSLSVVVLENATDINPCTCQSLHVYFIRRNISLRDWFDCPTIHEGINSQSFILFHTFFYYNFYLLNFFVFQ